MSIGIDQQFLTAMAYKSSDDVRQTDKTQTQRCGRDREAGRWLIVAWFICVFASLQTERWTHWCASFKPGTGVSNAWLYRNGKLEAQDTGTQSWSFNPATEAEERYFFGGDPPFPTSAGTTMTRIDEFRMWSGTAGTGALLTIQNIIDGYVTNTWTANAAVLQVYFPFNEQRSAE